MTNLEGLNGLYSFLNIKRSVCRNLNFTYYELGVDYAISYMHLIMYYFVRCG